MELKTYIALHLSKLIHRNRCRKGQNGPVLRVVRHTRSVKKRPPRGQIPFSTLSSPLSHPLAMQGFPSLSLTLTLEKRTAGRNAALNTPTNERTWWMRRHAEGPYHERCKKVKWRVPAPITEDLTQNVKENLKQALSSEISHPRYRSLAPSPRAVQFRPLTRLTSFRV